MSAEGLPPLPESYYRDQALTLRTMQLQISDELFTLGAAPVIVANVEPVHNEVVDFSGVDLWGKISTPSRVHTTYADGITEEVILLSIIDEAPPQPKCTHFYLGAVDSIGMLFPYPGVDAEAAEAVFGTAKWLQSVQADGILPDLDFGLLRVNNPYESRRLPPPR